MAMLSPAQRANGTAPRWAEHAAGVEMRALWLNVRDSYRLQLRAEENVAADSLPPHSAMAQPAKRASGLP
jgi:hypothetical protein